MDNKQELTKEEMIEKIIKLRAVKNELEARKYSKDLFEFNREVLGLEKAKDAVPLAPFHKELCEFVTSDFNKELILVPRAHLKSTIVTIGYTLMRIAADPTVRILIANATYDMACSFIASIKKHLKENERFRELYGDLATTAEKWSENMITVPKKQQFGVKKEATVTAFGIGGNLVSQHYDVIIGDDLVNRDYINTQEQIEKTILFYKDALDLLEPNGKFIIIGTRWHDADLYGWIMDETTPEQTYKDFKVFLRTAYTGDLETGEDLELLFPEKFTRESLQVLKRGKNLSEFSAQYMNDPMPQEDAMFKKEWFNIVDREEMEHREINYFTMVDPAISQKKDADKTAIVTIGVDQWNNWFVANIIWGHMRPDELITQIFRNFEIYHPNKIGVEMVAFQKSLSYALTDEMRRRNMFIPIVELKAERAKHERIEGLIPRYSNGAIFHLSSCPYRESMEEELMRFPRGRHDDIIDALAYGVQIAHQARKQKIERKRQHARQYLY